MTCKLPINLEDLLRQRTVEGERIEYKAGWNPDAVLHSICAFANDFHNLGGGYIVIGVKEKNVGLFFHRRASIQNTSTPFKKRS